MIDFAAIANHSVGTYAYNPYAVEIAFHQELDKIAGFGGGLVRSVGEHLGGFAHALGKVERQARAAPRLLRMQAKKTVRDSSLGKSLGLFSGEAKAKAEAAASASTSRAGAKQRLSEIGSRSGSGAQGSASPPVYSPLLQRNADPANPRLGLPTREGASPLQRETHRRTARELQAFDANRAQGLRDRAARVGKFRGVYQAGADDAVKNQAAIQEATAQRTARLEATRSAVAARDARLKSDAVAAARAEDLKASADAEARVLAKAKEDRERIDRLRGILGSGGGGGKGQAGGGKGQGGEPRASG